MRTELPKRWCVTARDLEEAEILTPYATKISTAAGYSIWTTNDAQKYYFKVDEDGYYGGGVEPGSFEELTFREFEYLVLNKTTEPQYEIY